MPDRGSSKIRTLKVSTRTKCQVNQVKESIDEVGRVIHLYKSEEEKVYQADAGGNEGSQPVLSKTKHHYDSLIHKYTFYIRGRTVRRTITKHDVSIEIQRLYNP